MTCISCDTEIRGLGVKRKEISTSPREIGDGFLAEVAFESALEGLREFRCAENVRRNSR